MLNLTDASESEEQVGDSRDKSFFNEVGLDHKTAESLINNKVIKKKMFTMKFDGRQFYHRITPEWRRLPLATKNGSRRKGGRWIDVLLKWVKKSNPYCCWKFYYNNIKKKESNKKTPATVLQKQSTLSPTAPV